MRSVPCRANGTQMSELLLVGEKQYGGFLHIQVFLQDPLTKGFEPRIDPIGVFKNASGLDIRQRERLGVVLDVAGLGDQLVDHLATERNDRAVSMNSTRFDVAHTSLILEVWDLNITVFLAFIGEYLHPEIDL